MSCLSERVWLAAAGENQNVTGLSPTQDVHSLVATNLNNLRSFKPILLSTDKLTTEHPEEPPMNEELDTRIQHLFQDLIA